MVRASREALLFRLCSDCGCLHDDIAVLSMLIVAVHIEVSLLRLFNKAINVFFAGSAANGAEEVNKSERRTVLGMAYAQ